MCNWFNNKMEEDENWINNVCFSDEAHFHLDGYVNSKNCIFWETELPPRSSAVTFTQFEGHSLVCNKF